MQGRDVSQEDIGRETLRRRITNINKKKKQNKMRKKKLKKVNKIKNDPIDKFS